MSGRRIVIVDNDEAVLRLLDLDLKLEGHEILDTGVNGEEAIAACSQHHPDVLVVDLRLGPGIDGIGVAEKLQGSGIRVVVYTNYINAAVVKFAEEAGATVVEKGNLSALRRAISA